MSRTRRHPFCNFFCFVSLPKTNPRILFRIKNPKNSTVSVCVSTFQYVSGVCSVCLAHQLAVVVVVAIKETRKQKEKLRNPQSIWYRKALRSTLDGVLLHFELDTDVSVYRSASLAGVRQISFSPQETTEKKAPPPFFLEIKIEMHCRLLTFFQRVNPFVAFSVSVLSSVLFHHYFG